MAANLSYHRRMIDLVALGLLSSPPLPPQQLSMSCSRCTNRTPVPSQLKHLEADFYENVAFALTPLKDGRTGFTLRDSKKPSRQGRTWLDINDSEHDLYTRGERIFQMLRHRPWACCQPDFEASYSIQHDRTKGLARGVGWILGGTLTKAEIVEGVTHKAENLFTTEWYADPQHVSTGTVYSERAPTTHTETAGSTPTIGEQSTVQLGSLNAERGELPVPI
jgi:hypothetical protein